MVIPCSFPWRVARSQPRNAAPPPASIIQVSANRGKQNAASGVTLVTELASCGCDVEECVFRGLTAPARLEASYPILASPSSLRSEVIAISANCAGGFSHTWGFISSMETVP